MDDGPATVTLSGPGDVRTLTLTYPELDRTLEIQFGGAFPHIVLGWRESYPSGFGPDAQVLTTEAVWGMVGFATMTILLSSGTIFAAWKARQPIEGSAWDLVTIGETTSE